MRTSLADLNADGTEGVVLDTPADAEPLLRDLLPTGFRLFAQRGETLRERLIDATAELLSNEFESVCLINSDSPTLPGEILTTVASLLAQEGDRVVVGPASNEPFKVCSIHR